MLARFPREDPASLFGSPSVVIRWKSLMLAPRYKVNAGLILGEQSPLSILSPFYI